MMKQFVHNKLCKLQILVFLVLLLVGSVTNIYADEWAMPSVIDEAGYLSDEDKAALTERLDQLRDEFPMDVAVYIEDVMSGDNAQDTADDLFDYNDYGYGADKDGILLYISKSPRKYHFTTHGLAMTVFNDRGLAYMEGQVLPDLKEDDYASALNAYADTAEELLNMAADGEVYDTFRTKTSDAIMVALVILIPLILAFAVTGGKVRRMHTARQANYADRYIKKGSFQLTASQDIFLYSTVTRTEHTTSDDSSSHTSSSGETHGGCGGDY